MPAPTKRPITAEDIYNFELLSGVRISPDGSQVIYVQNRVDPKSQKKFSNLWMTSTDKTRVKQFTYGDQSDSQPKWSPDGLQIAFLSNRGNPEKPARIYLIPIDGGEARPLSDIPGEIEAFSWRPDGRQIVCAVRKTDAQTLEREKDEQKKKLGVVVRHYERLFYKLDGYGYLPRERIHLWSLDAATGKAKQLTDHPVWDESSPAYSPDGQWIAFLSNRLPDPDTNPDAVDLLVMPSSGGEPRKVSTPRGEKSHPAFSPDGKWIAYFGKDGESNWYKNTGLWVVPADGAAPAHNLTAPYDLDVSAGVINDFGTTELMPPAWSPDSQALYFQTGIHGSSLLMRIQRDGSSLIEIIGEGGALGSFSFDRQQKRLAFFYGKMDDPGQVYLKDFENGNLRTLTQVNQTLLSRLDLGSMEEIWCTGPDGNPLQGWILKPPGFDQSKKYPSILEIHGGPLAQYGNFFMHEFYYLAAQGYVVHFTNPRGGRGYGEEHARAIWQDWGGADYRDLMAWCDRVEKLPYIDAQRMGVTGGSYGGYMTVWIIGHTQRFKAAVTQRCVSNFVSMWGTSDFNWTFQQVLSDKPPFEDLQKFWDHSPIKYIGNAKTPTLVSHSEFDLRCPIEQGEQVFVALKRLGVDTEMIRFPDEFHGLSRTGRADRRIARLKHFARWFDRHLKKA